MMKFQSMSKHFSSSQCHRLNYTVILENNTGIPNSVIQRDLNKNRINARHKLLLSSLKIKIGLQLYEVTHNVTNFPTEGGQASAREIEGVLNAAKSTVIFAQYEKLLIGAYGPGIKNMI